MDTSIQKIKNELNSQHYDGLDAITAILYQHFVSSDSQMNEAARRQYDIIDNYLQDLPFLPKDRILCAANALCVEYERAAFSDGFRTGARLILDLLEAEV